MVLAPYLIGGPSWGPPTRSGRDLRTCPAHRADATVSVAARSTARGYVMHFGKLDAAERDVLLQAAILAPSMHNTQPWKFRFHGTTVEVHRDPRYELPAEDPERRMVLISIGAVLLNLRVAAASLGYDVAVGVDPDPGRTLVAELTVALMPGAGDHSLAGLFPALGRRRTNRQPF